MLSEHDITHSPVLITGRAVDIDIKTEEVEIAFLRDWKWKKLWISRKTLCDAKSIISLSEHGLPVNSVNSRKLVEYLCTFENVNLPVIKKTYVTRGLGWKEIDNKRIFLASKATENQIIDFIPEPGFERFAKALTPVGSYEKWKEASTLAIQMPVPNFAFYASFTPPLLNLLKAPNFIIDFWGLTSKGKTTTLKLAASVWGNPHKETFVVKPG